MIDDLVNDGLRHNIDPLLRGAFKDTPKRRKIGGPWKNIFSGETVLVTGNFRPHFGHRQLLAAIVEDFGGITAKNASKKVTLMLIGEKHGTAPSGKQVKMEALGLPSNRIMYRADFINMLEEFRYPFH